MDSCNILPNALKFFLIKMISEHVMRRNSVYCLLSNEMIEDVVQEEDKANAYWQTVFADLKVLTLTLAVSNRAVCKSTFVHMAAQGG